MRRKYIDEQGRVVIIKRVRVPRTRYARSSRRGELLGFLTRVKKSDLYRKKR